MHTCIGKFRRTCLFHFAVDRDNIGICVRPVCIHTFNAIKALENMELMTSDLGSLRSRSICPVLIGIERL